mgnify:CR=1 FL=1
MKKILDIRHIVIVLLLLICALEFLNPKGFMPNRTKIVTQIDSIPFEVHDTTEIEVPVEVEVLYEVKVPYEVKVEVPVIQSVDTAQILKSHFAKIQYKDVLKLPNNQGTVTIIDTIANNTIVNRKFIADVKRMIINDTIYTQIPRKTEVYFGFDAKFDKPVQLLNASVPAGVGVLNHSSGAVPVNAFAVELILYKLVNVVTFILFVNCNTFVNALQFLNVDEKFIANVFVSNNVDGTDVNPVQAKKHDANVVANGTLSNNPVGTVVIVVIEEKLSVNVVAFGE